MKMRKGFTLIELLIVLAIIAALMAVVTPIALNAVKKAKATQVAENFRNIRAAVESYVNVEQAVPEGTKTLQDEGYLNNVPSNFTLSSTRLGSGQYVIEIVYTGGDVDVTAIQDVYSEIDATDTTPYLRLTVQKWW